MYNGKLDDKGRLKMPVPFQEYLNSFTEKKLFVTSVDNTTAQIYPISVWRENEQLFKISRAVSRSAKELSFLANDLGADAEMDAQGRILLNPELRRDLDMDGHALRLVSEKGRIQILTEAVYQAHRKAARANALANLEAMEEAGML